MKDIVIIGAGGFGREVEWLIERINKINKEWNILGFVDDNIEKNMSVGNSKVIYNINDLININRELNVVIAIGNAKIRKLLFDKLKNNININFPNLIDPSVIVENINIGKGNIICAGTIITVNVKIKDFTIINLDCTIGHDDIINEFVTIYPSVNVSGNVEIGEGTEVGTGTQIIQGKTICNNCVIGAGAVVVKNIEEEGTYVGVPARKLGD